MKLDQLGNFSRSHRNGELRMDHVGQTVRLLGWCKRSRNMGSLVFLDLRDRWGVVQIKADETEIDPGLLSKLKAVRSEFVLGIEGIVIERQSKNPNMLTGDVEVSLTDLKIFNTALTPPIPVDDGVESGMGTGGADAGEDLRLKYRFLDLRRPSLQRSMILRSEVASIIRNHFRELDFIEIETPSSPNPHRKAPGITWCHRESIRANSSRCPNRRSSSSSCSRYQASSATSRSAAVFATKICAQIASLNSHKWTSK